MKLLNAFSLSMLESEKATVEVRAILKETARNFLERNGLESYIGHPSTADVLANLLGMAVPVRRDKAVLRDGESAIVAQYNGPRLPEGATQLPKGASIEFRLVTIHEEPLYQLLDNAFAEGGRSAEYGR